MKADYDLIVIGAGSAGLTAARFARQLGLSAALVERSRVGGDCTWTGCVPSKALLKAAGIVHSMRTADRIGLPNVSPDVDLRAVMERIRTVIGHIYDTESPDTLANEGIDVISGEASFTSTGSVAVDGRMLTARRFLIATGASPVIPPIHGLDGVAFHTYETVWEMEDLPTSLAVVGAGAVGCELAQAFARLGSDVTLVEAAGRILPQEDPDVSEVIERRFADEGISVMAGESVQAVSAARERGARIETSSGRMVEADTLLVAVGRRANTDGLGLDAAGVAYGPTGITVDRHLRTSRKGIYAAGDVTGGPQFTHYAGWQGFMAVRNAFLPSNARAVLDLVPRATFTDPEAAQAGLTETEAKDRLGSKALASRWPLPEVDRALTDGETDGFVKAVHDGKGTILGVTIVAPRAGRWSTSGLWPLRKVSSWGAWRARFTFIRPTRWPRSSLRFGSSRSGCWAEGWVPCCGGSRDGGDWPAACWMILPDGPPANRFRGCTKPEVAGEENRSSLDERSLILRGTRSF